ncbi:MAG: hypothetical protein JXA93_23610 [Anaerolineae bacterium]|nr:hypothetical protein [Anaerolineae bacterium]
MTTPTDRVRTQPLKMILVVAAWIAVIVYGTLSVTAQDPLWFLRRVEAHPVRFVIYHHEGKLTDLRPGQEGFDQLSSAVQAALEQGIDRPSGIGFSDASLLDAYSRYITVEVFFDPPALLDAPYAIGEPTQMLIPITGRHSDQPLVLLGNEGKYWSNAPLLHTVEPIRRALQELGYYMPQVR